MGEIEKVLDGCDRPLQNGLPFHTDCSFFLSPGKVKFYVATNIHSDYIFIPVAVIVLNYQV